jgi:hypothetical protein
MFLTADLKYHQFYESENQIREDMDTLKAKDIQNYIVDSFKKITNFAIVLSQENTNPVKYF